MNLKEAFDKDGYIVVPSLFSSEEIEEIRGRVKKQMDEDTKNGDLIHIPNTTAVLGAGDLLSKEHLSSVLLDKRVVGHVTKILGDEWCYFGDSSYQIGVGNRGWHRDNVDREYKSGPDWEGEYTIIRVGLYLQSYKDFSGGLKLKQGSHKNASGKSRFLNSTAGDLALWDLKTLHSGNAVRLKFLKNLDVNHFEKYVPKWLSKGADKERMSIFMTFAKRSNHLERYLDEYFKVRKDTVNHIESSKWDEEMIRKAEEAGVTVYNVGQPMMESK